MRARAPHRWAAAAARLAGLLALWLCVGPGAARARTYLVAIGNDVGRPDEVELRYARRDAERVAETLRRVGGVGATDSVLLTNTDVTHALSTLDAVARRIAAEAPAAQAALVVYYSGHADAVGLHLGDSTLPYAELRARVARVPAAVRVLVIDGCRSGGLTRVKGATPAAPFELRLEDTLAVEGTAVMTSSAAGEDSHESDRLGGSFFTHHLVAALLGAGDHDGDGKVTLTEAYLYAYRHTLHASGRTATLQHPTYRYDLKGRGDFVLSRPSEAVGSGGLKLGAPARYLARADSAQGPLRVELSPDRAGVTVSLAPGPYFIQERHPDHYREYAVTVGRDQVVDLAAVASSRVAYARLVRKGGAARLSQGVTVLGGARVPVLDGRGVVPEVVLGYAVDLPWLTAGLRGRWAQGDATVDGVAVTDRQLGLALTVERVFDVTGWLSLGAGLIVEGVQLSQALPDETRTAWGLVFGGLFSAEVPLTERLSVRLEGGPVTHTFRRAIIDNGAQVGDATTSRVTGQGALGLGVKF